MKAINESAGVILFSWAYAKYILYYDFSSPTFYAQGFSLFNIAGITMTYGYILSFTSF